MRLREDVLVGHPIPIEKILPAVKKHSMLVPICASWGGISDKGVNVASCLCVSCVCVCCVGVLSELCACA